MFEGCWGGEPNSYEAQGLSLKFPCEPPSNLPYAVNASVVALASGEAAVSLHLGYHVSCVLLTSGRLRCFGFNYNGIVAGHSLVNCAEPAGNLFPKN